MESNFNENTSSDNLLNNIYFHKYKPVKKLGEGSFGLIFQAENIQDNEVYALKFEERRAGQNLLESEAYVMSYLKGGKNKLIIILSWNSYGEILRLFWRL
jgi:serine/threonine protein kinase